MVEESLPDLEIPQATVSTAWPGADPDTIEQEVTEVLENELSTLHTHFFAAPPSRRNRRRRRGVQGTDAFASNRTPRCSPCWNTPPHRPNRPWWSC